MKTLIQRLRENGYGDLAAVVVSQWLEELANDESHPQLDDEQHYRSLKFAAREAVRDLPPDAFQNNR